jgi:hypothetical protein
MLLAETASPLDGLASAMSVVLIVEACIIVMLVAAITLLLAFGLKWLHSHVVPLLQEYVPTVSKALGATDRASGQVVDLVANLYARRRGFEEGVRGFFASLWPIFGALFTDRPLPTDAPSANGHGPAPMTSTASTAGASESAPPPQP